MFLPDGRSLKVDVHPASHSQQRMWFLHEYAEAAPVYVIPSAFHLKGLFDVDIFLAAVTDVARRHDTLRTTFVIEDGQLLQRVSSEPRFLREFRTLDPLPTEERAEAAAHDLEEFASRKFDLAESPGFRVSVLRLGPEEHVVCFVIHHIISDGWSRSNLWRDVALAYEARINGSASAQTPLAVQFADYADWQRGQLVGGSLEKMAEFWKNQLSGDLEPLDLPADRARPPKESFRGARVSMHLDSGLTESLTARAREEGVTFFMILLAAFKTLLSRYTGQEDLLVGVPIANRQRAEIEGLVGFFANTLVMRTSLSGDPTFRELLHRVKETAIQAYANQDMPFEKLVEMLDVRRNAGHSPVFQVSFALQDFPAVTLDLPGITASPWPTETRTSKFDLSLAVERTPSGWMATADFSTDLFDSDRIERMLGHWRVMLESVSKDPDQHLHEIPLLTQTERQQLLVEWNDTARDYPRDKCLHQLFEEQVESTPDAVAIEFEGTQLTYRELNSRANQIALHLRSLGMKPDLLIGLCVDRSPNMVAGLLGILKAGATYVPLDPDFPSERLAFMMEDAAMPLLLTERKVQDRLPRHSAQVVWIDELEWLPMAKNLTVASSVESLAYVIYTSGSTGRPKGVEISNRALVNCLFHFRHSLNAGTQDVWIATTTLSFDIAALEIWLPLIVGARCILATRETAMDATRLNQILLDRGVTHLQATPATWKILLLSGWRGNSTLQILCGGEAVSQDLADQLADLGAAAWNVYGPTETTIWATAKKLRCHEPVNIGHALANIRIYLLDSYGQVVPVGVPGHILIGGDCLARGYRNQPALTAERFIPNPFDSKPGARLYRTGDLGRWLPNRNVEFLGRVDNQVKLRGFRIELGEIEAALGTRPEIHEAVVIVREDIPGDKRLVAYLVALAEEKSDVSTLRAQLASSLPQYMIPSAFVWLDHLPLTPNGKIDRKALQRLEAASIESGVEYLPPRSEVERELVNIWKIILGYRQVGISDNFFEMGGHSLLAVKLSSKIAEMLAFDVPLRWVFEHPTIESLAKRMESFDEPTRHVAPIPRADRQLPLPLSFAQQGMWLLQQTMPNHSAYNMSVAWHLDGSIDKTRIRRALEVIQSRHDVLRTALVNEEGSLVQQIGEWISLPWEEVDLQGVADGERDAALEARLLAAARQPFDLAQAPLWRVLWVEVSGKESVLGFMFHHAIMDEWSMRLFFQELGSLYEAMQQAQIAKLPDLPVQYADYAAWERARVAGSEFVTQTQYWCEQLRDLPPDLDLPSDLPKPIGRSGRGSRQNFQISAEVVAKLQFLSREENTTLFMTALAAYQAWLYRITGQSDLVVATPITGRERQEVQTLLGCFLNTLPIRSRLDGELGFRKFLGQVRQTVLDAFEHSRFPFEKMVELAVRKRTADSHPLHQVMFVFLEEGVPELILGGGKRSRVPMHTGVSKCDLNFSVLASPQRWNCQLEYASEQFTKEDVTGMANQLKELLESIAESPHLPLDELRIMPGTELHQLLVEWNRSVLDYPRDTCVHQLFEDQAERTPQAVALLEGDVSLSYLEVNLRANRLARYLRSLGVGPDVLVGLLTERSADAIVTVIGILKAGGAYVPLDPKLPDERLKCLLGEIQSPLLICQDSERDRLASLAREAISGCRTLVIGHLESLSSDFDGANLPCSSKSTDLAYVMFTSGTTGQPKGVMVPHRGIVRLVINPDYVDLGSEDVMLHYAPLSFDASTFEIWGALLNGARLVVAAGGLLDFAELGNLIAGHRVTTLWLTAALFHQMVEQQPLALAGVRQLLSGGDVLMPSRVREYLELPGHGRLINGYGPTESTTFTCCAAFDHPNQIADRVTIGRPISGTRVYILDPRGRPVPTGVAGELYAGGDGLAIGYLKAPELTSERFVADPFSDDPGARLYRTGDLVRWRSDGNIDFLGRTDHQVKIRGYRIELGEIEHALRQCNGVSDAAVIPRVTDSGEKQLIAYLQPLSSTYPCGITVRSELSAILPDYAIPAAFVRVDQLPLNSHGKLDRMALPGVEGAELSAGRGHVAARTELERRLVSIWQKLLGREEIGVHDNFFEIGGHSIQAARLASEIEKLVGQRLPISAFFQSPTIALLALRLVDERWVPAWNSLVPLQPFGSRPPLFLLHGWGGDVYAFIELARHLAPEQPVYGVQAAGLDGRQPKHTSVKEMAAHYVEEICSLQPEGPYHLCGFSLGGLIAYETAQQLRRQGKSVAVLALLDTNPLGPIPPLLHALLLLLRVPGRLSFHAREFSKTPMSRRIRYLQGRFYALRNLLLKNRKSKHSMKLPDPETGLFPENPKHSDYFQEVASSYEVGRYDGDLDVFLSDEASSAMQCYWRIMTKGRARYHRVPGRHREILSPDNLPALTGALVKVISGRTRICRKQ